MSLTRDEIFARLSTSSETRGDNKIILYLANPSRDMLYEAVSHPDVSKVVEVGSAYGGSSFLICSVLANKPDSFFVSIDNHKEHQAWNSFSPMMGQFENVCLFKCDQHVAPSFIAGDFDLIFVDGAHRYDIVKKDIAMWEHRTRFFVFHDYFEGQSGSVAQAVDELIATGTWKVLAKNADMIYLEKRDG